MAPLSVWRASCDGRTEGNDQTLEKSEARAGNAPTIQRARAWL